MTARRYNRHCAFLGLSNTTSFKKDIHCPHKYVDSPQVIICDLTCFIKEANTKLSKNCIDLVIIIPYHCPVPDLHHEGMNRFATDE
mmetsp:Transcript_53618/g.142141  ORF Transcript_53618/g.142141 Transcript_53618/m.142141 type:complete len:86 (-) Transcript_53618:632-889(-)